MDAETIHELFREFGPVSVRRMFGGRGVFVDGRMIALVARDLIHLKADAETIPAFEAEGLGAFTYATRNGEHQLTSYWRMPERLYDDPEELAQWARRSLAVAMRATARKEKPKTADKPVRRPSRATPKRPRGRSRT
jgi:DNA transformation protein and related proteins